MTARHLKRMALLCLFIVPLSVSATDLLNVYKQANASSPALKQQHYTAQSVSAQSGAARSILLPSISLTGTAAANRLSPAQIIPTGNFPSVKNYGKNTFQANLSQVVFNIPSVLTYWQAHRSADAADSNFSYQQQQFMGNVANAYFNVLQAKATLTFDEKRIEYLQKSLTQAREQFKVGLKTERAVKQAESSFFTAKAQYVADKSAYRNDPQNPQAPSLQSALEQLRQLTGKTYQATDFPTLKENFPFNNPDPANIDYWVKKAISHNANLRAQRQNSEAAHASARSNYAAWLPSASFVGSYTYNSFSSIAAANVDQYPFLNQKHTSSTSIAFNLSWNIFSGGANFANAFQAASTYQAQLAFQRLTHRQIVNQVRQDYLSLIKDASTIDAYKQAVVSAQASVDQYQAQYQVGTSDITDLLNQIQLLFQAKLQLAASKYQYINDYLKLKIDTGLISLGDLRYLNRYLNK